MDVRNCRSCGKLFNYMGGPPLCPACIKKLDEKFIQVKAYIYDNPEAGIQQVAEDNDVTTSQIKNWIREERLSFSKESSIGLECERCGAMIKTGRFCKSCKEKMANNLENVYKKPNIQQSAVKKPKDGSAKMRFLDN